MYHQLKKNSFNDTNEGKSIFYTFVRQSLNENLTQIHYHIHRKDKRSTTPITQNRFFLPLRYHGTYDIISITNHVQRHP